MPLITRSKLNLYANRRLRNTKLQTAGEVIRYDNRIAEFSEFKNYDIFLCHSFSDAKAILGLKEYFGKLGFSTYVDWDDDPQLDRTRVNKKTVDILRKRMKNSRCLFFASSDNSSFSKWMPWELGYFDGFKSKVAICPITESAIQAKSESYKGQEYLSIYPYVADGQIEKTNQETLWIHDSKDDYKTLEEWLKNRKYRRFTPTRRTRILQ